MTGTNIFVLIVLLGLLALIVVPFRIVAAVCLLVISLVLMAPALGILWVFLKVKFG